MSSRLQLDVRNFSLGRRHLVNAYEVRCNFTNLQVKLSDPYLSGLSLCDVYVGGKVRVSEFMIFLDLQHRGSE